MKHHQLIPWRTFPAVHALAFRHSPSDHGLNSVDWKSYESSRTWWRCLAELNSLPR